jgi:hypothetical protein
MYTNNKEYRQTLREFFQMKMPEYTDIDTEDIDEETIDEVMYDSESVEKTMNEIFAKTKDINAFIKIYEIAASHMFSVDLETGLAVLLSYDYFLFFYAFYKKFHDSNIDSLENTKEYQELLEKINPCIKTEGL